MALHKDYKGFICSILGSLETWYFRDELYNTEQILPNIINSCVFIVKDKDKFINILPKTLFDKFEGSINQGPQSTRGQISSSFNYLSILDKHFRDSLYYHNKHHHTEFISHYLNKRGVKSDKDLEGFVPLLERKKFSFNNIHMNLGYVRWYSTLNRVSNSHNDLIKPLNTHIDSK